MPKTSGLGRDAILKTFPRIIRQPWIASRLAVLELEKKYFNLLHPRRREGTAGRIRQVGIRLRRTSVSFVAAPAVSGAPRGSCGGGTSRN
ncbi:MAG: hypothetical protein V1816_23275 [Pseudomonadota bacterium]